MNNLFPIFIVILLAGAGVLGDYFIKVAGSGLSYISYRPFFIGMIIYAGTAVGWLYVMKHVQLSTLGIYYSLATIILLVIVGGLFFGEKLNTYEIVGIIFGIISIILLTRFG